jgi:hypothetical protein
MQDRSDPASVLGKFSDLEELLCLSICYLFYFRVQIASRAAVQVSTIKLDRRCLPPQLPAQLQGARLPTAPGGGADLCFVFWS